MKLPHSLIRLKVTPLNICLLLLCILLVGCASNTRNIIVKVRDASTKSLIKNGEVSMDRLSLFSVGPVGYNSKIEPNGYVLLDGVVPGSWAIKFDIKGYDISSGHFSFSGDEKQLNQATWVASRNLRRHPNFSDKVVEYSIDFAED